MLPGQENIPLSHSYQSKQNLQESKDYAHDIQTNASSGSSCPAPLLKMLLLVHDYAIAPLQWESSWCTKLAHYGPRFVRASLRRLAPPLFLKVRTPLPDRRSGCISLTSSMEDVTLP
jgi:hypothetical protein